jgi:alpha-N-arabinofuranosidase
MTAPVLGTAALTVHPAFDIADVHPRLFGSFVEHLGRGVYGGIFEPGHPTADEHGFRTDVLALVRELGVTTVRYPGGNFVSGYDWRDGVGPVEDRPRRLDPAWRSTETNAFGTDDFIRWCRAAGVEPMLAVNLGTGDIRSALHLLEYANHPGGTTLSDERRANGSPEPHRVRMWCLGNEMDGPWQIGHLDAAAYGTLAARTGAAMRAVDPDLELVVCGSSNDRMETFGAWEQTVLTHTIAVADHISCHQYARNDGDLRAFLASGVDMDHFIDSVAATIRQVQAATRSTRDITISFDEWNVWDYRAHDEHDVQRAGWEVAPPLLEDHYTVADAVVVGDMLISLINHADVVKAASMAQLVNVIGPILTETGGRAWRQTTFFPFADARRSAGRTALRVDARCTPGGDGRDRSPAVPAVSAAAALDRFSGALDLYLAQRDPDVDVDVDVDLRGFDKCELIEATILHHRDPLTTNGHQETVVPTPLAATIVDGRLRLRLPPVAWATVRLQVRV